MQLIVFEPDGSIEYTRNPLTDALFEGERKRVVRMSLIEHDEQLQKFYVQFITGPFKDTALSLSTPGWHDFMRSLGYVGQCNPLCIFAADGKALTWTYEEGVKLEVAFVTFLREQGYSLQ